MQTVVQFKYLYRKSIGQKPVGAFSLYYKKLIQGWIPSGREQSPYFYTFMEPGIDSKE
jgi:hypothetical protein